MHGSLEDSHATSEQLMHKTIVKNAAAALPQKQGKTPNFQGFLHSDPQRKPVNIGVHRPSFFQQRVSGRDSRAT
jgi:hypothetical protein